MNGSTAIHVHIHQQNSVNIRVASFPDSTPQLFIALCEKAGEWRLGTRLY